MNDFVPFFTKDGSVGLYSNLDNDIYHSVYGALTEAYNKFILPADFINYFINKKEIKILDLCYGIGYNTKSFLNYFFQKVVPVTESIDTIDTDNNFIKKYDGTIDTNNVKIKNQIKLKYFDYLKNNFITNKNLLKNFSGYKIKIDAVDTNELLMKFSPLFKMNSSFNNPNNTGIENVDKYLNKNVKFDNSAKYKIISEVNMILLHYLFDTFGENYLSSDFITLMNDKNYHKFLCNDIRRFMAFYFSKRYKCSSGIIKSTFLHNIYYEYLSESYKNVLKVLKNNDFKIRYINEDARTFLKDNDIKYDFIFLDAFSPNKCPNLWSFDFFTILYNHLSEDGKILTYSNSSAVRNAMIKNKFYIGKIFNESENKFTGTIAVKNENLIKNKLSEYEIGLINTKAGIMYRDVSLNLSNADILNNRIKDYNNSSLITSTMYKKNYKGDKHEL